MSSSEKALGSGSFSSNTAGLSARDKAHKDKCVDCGPADWRKHKGRVKGIVRRKGETDPKKYGLFFDDELLKTAKAAKMDLQVLPLLTEKKKKKKKKKKGEPEPAQGSGSGSGSGAQPEPEKKKGLGVWWNKDQSCDVM